MEEILNEEQIKELKDLMHNKEELQKVLKNSWRELVGVMLDQNLLQ